MAGMLDDYSNLAAVSSAVKSFGESYERAQDREYKDIERKAQMEALKSKTERETFENSLSQRQQRIKVDLAKSGQEAEFDESGEFKGSRYKPEYLSLLEKKAQGANPIALTTAEEAVDKSFGKDYADYVAGGGRATVDKNLSLLEGAIAELEKPGELSGGISGLGGDFVQDIANPKMASVRDQIRSAIQTSLKQVLGGQYTEKEGAAIFNRAFNPRLSDAENIKKAQKELEAIRAMADAKDASGKFYEEKRTLRGFKGKSGGQLPQSAMPQGQLPAQAPASDPMAAQKLKRLEELRAKAAGR